MLSTVCIASLMAGSVYAAETTQEAHKTLEKLEQAKQDFEKTIDEYKKYAISIDTKVREEIIEYRKSIAELNKKKRELYQKLSQEAQSFLKKEQEYRKKLPIEYKKQINPKNTDEKDQK